MLKERKSSIKKGLLINMKSKTELEKPGYCKDCKQCRNTKTVYKNLKVVRNTGWTHDIYCEKLKTIVYGM